MSHSMRKVPYHDFLGPDMSQREGFLFVYHHKTSGVSRVFDEAGQEVICWGGDCEGDKAERLGNILLGREDEGPLAEFEGDELEQLKKWMWGETSRT